MNFIFHLIIKLFIVHMVFFNQNSVNGVVVNDIILFSSNPKADYVLTGESFTLTCLYMLELRESVSFVQWDLNNLVIYVHKTDLDKPLAAGIFKDRVDYNIKSTNSISIRNATKELAGRYSCHVFTNLTSASGTAVTTSRYIYIIQNSCTQANWKTHSDMINCREQISFSCGNLYPKPLAACALYNEYSGSIINTVINRITPDTNHTYHLNVFANFDLEEIQRIQRTDHFFNNLGKLTVEHTSWRQSFVHSLFAESVCLVENENKSIKSFIKKPDYMFNENQITVLHKEAGCLVGYREGSIIRADCARNNPLLVCVNASWTPVDKSNSYDLSDRLIKKEKIDWTKLILNYDADVRCDSCYQYLNPILLLFVFLMSRYDLWRFR